MEFKYVIDCLAHSLFNHFDCYTLIHLCNFTSRQQGLHSPSIFAVVLRWPEEIRLLCLKDANLL